jgi:hypothetical protein
LHTSSPLDYLLLGRYILQNKLSGVITVVKYNKDTMAFVKGDTRINLNGRPKGALNRTTEQMRLTINRAVNNTLNTIQSDLEELKKTDPVKALELSMKLMEYAMPKMRSIDLKGSIEVDQRIQSININITKSGSGS